MQKKTIIKALSKFTGKKITNKEFTNLENKYEKIDISKDGEYLLLTTEEIFITYNKIKYYIGQIKIIFPIKTHYTDHSRDPRNAYTGQALNFKFYNKTFPNQKIPHPHILGENIKGKMTAGCFGNLKLVIDLMLREKNLMPVLHLVHEFLHSLNTDTLAYSYHLQNNFQPKERQGVKNDKEDRILSEKKQKRN